MNGTERVAGGSQRPAGVVVLTKVSDEWADRMAQRVRREFKILSRERVEIGNYDPPLLTRRRVFILDSLSGSLRNITGIFETVALSKG